MIHPVPKPKPKVKVRVSVKHGKPLKRGKRIKSVNRKRGGSSFPKVRDKNYRDWVRLENACMLLTNGGGTFRRTTPDDFELANGSGFIHRCWGHVTPAHVGEHQARGAPDFGVIVPLCEAAHTFYDHRRWEWRKATGYSERKMASAASGYALKYVEQGGAAVRAGGTEP